jgi:fibronectin-binding autotransporter adhesin
MEKSAMRVWSWVAVVGLLPMTVAGGPQLNPYKLNNTDNLNLASSWGNDLPGFFNTGGAWTSVVTADNATSLGANLGWYGMSSTTSCAVTINAGNTLTLGSGNGASGIKMTSAGGPVTLNCGLGVPYSQTWSVASGRTLTVGGDVLLGAALTVASTGTTAISGNISGTGSISKSGAGQLTLSGGNSYSGGTAVTLGTLKVGQSAALGTGAVTVNGGTLDLNAAAVANAINYQSGTLVNMGTATTTNVQSGAVLNTSGLTIGGTTNVLTGATLRGTGTLGALSLNGGVLAPGNSLEQRHLPVGSQPSDGRGG